MLPPLVKGLFVAVDGPSGVGKSTVSRLLAKKIRLHDQVCLLTTTPSGSDIGALARSGTHRYLGKAMTCLVAADRYDHYEQVIAPAIAAREIVVCDRYVVSSLVLDQLDGVTTTYVAAVYDGIGVPDLAIVLLAEPEVCLERAFKRGQYSRFHHTTLAACSREVDRYSTVATQLAHTGYPIVRHDIGQATAEQVADALMKVIVTRAREDRQ
jgi:dTMP kinase